MMEIFIGAITCSLWYVILFYNKTIGLSMLLFALPFAYFIIHILEKNKENLNKRAKFFLIPITLLASTYFIFNNTFFYALNTLAIPLLIILMILELYREEITIDFKMIGRVCSVIFKPIQYIFEAFRKCMESLKKNEKITQDDNKKKNTKRIFKATIITIPIAFVVIQLLSSADASFANIFETLFNGIDKLIKNIQMSTTLEISILIIVAFFYFLGFFYYICYKFKKNENTKEEKIKDSFTIKMILGVLNVIYLIFCYLQIRSLFLVKENINFSLLARQGFFQLMLVSFINLVMILIAKKRENSQYIRIMSLAMVLFTFIIIISATVRMYHYENAYGYTTLRLLVYCALFTEIVMLIPTIMYIIDKKINLAKAYLYIVTTIYICMNFANFNYIIAKRNVDRYIETGKIDIFYLQRTGTDGIKQVARILDIDKYEDNNKSFAKANLQVLKDYLNEEQMDFRDFNISKLIAKNFLKNDELNISLLKNEKNIDTNTLESSSIKIPDKNNSIQNNNNVIYTNSKVGYYIQNGIYYATTDGGKTFKQIISKEKAATIADLNAKNEIYQYQPWKSEFYSRGKNGTDEISAKLCLGLDEIDRLYHWKDEWKTNNYNGQLMWQIRLFDENDPLTSLYIYIDCETSEILGAGESSD